MNYAIHVLTASEETAVITLADLGKVDQAIIVLGNKFSEVTGITVVAVDVYGKDIAVLHKQTFFTQGE